MKNKLENIWQLKYYFYICTMKSILNIQQPEHIAKYERKLYA